MKQGVLPGLKLKSKYLWIPFGVALCAVVPLRVYQLLFLMDERGFYTDGDIISWVLMGILFASLAFFFISSIKNKALPKRYAHTRSFPSAIAHLGTGVAAIIYSILEILRIAMPSDSASALSGGFLYVAIILAMVGVGAGIVWLVMGVASLINKNLLRMLPTAGILPAIWLAIMLFTNVVQFSGNNIALNSTEHIYDTMTVILMTMFSFNECKMVAGAQGKKCGKRIYAYGLPMILFGVVSALPSFIGLATGNGSTGSFDLVLSIMIGFFCIATAIFLILVPRGKDAYVEELIEIVPEEEKTKEEENQKTDGKAKEQGEIPIKKTGVDRKEALKNAILLDDAGVEMEAPKGPKQPLPLRMMHGVLKFLESVFSKEKRVKKQRGKLFKAGELDEQATMGMSEEQWRLDFYGIREDEGPFYPKFYELDPGAMEKRKAMVEEAVMDARIYQAELEEEMRRKKGKKSKVAAANAKSKKYEVKIPQVRIPTVRKPGSDTPPVKKPTNNTSANKNTQNSTKKNPSEKK